MIWGGERERMCVAVYTVGSRGGHVRVLFSTSTGGSQSKQSLKFSNHYLIIV